MHTQTLPIGNRLPLQRRAQTCSRKPQRIQAQANAAFAATLEKSQQSPQTAENQLDALKQVCHRCALASEVMLLRAMLPEHRLMPASANSISIGLEFNGITSPVRSSWIRMCWIAVVSLGAACRLRAVDVPGGG